MDATVPSTLGNLRAIPCHLDLRCCSLPSCTVRAFPSFACRGHAYSRFLSMPLGSSLLCTTGKVGLRHLHLLYMVSLSSFSQVSMGHPSVVLTVQACQEEMSLSLAEVVSTGS